MKPILTILLALAAPASAATHKLSVRVSHGKDVWAETLVLTDGEQKSDVAKVSGRSLIVNTLAASDPNVRGRVDLQYQVELSAGPSSPEPVLQVQGDSMMRLGRPVQLVSCGLWTLELGVDSKGARARKDFGGGDGNVRLTAELDRGGAKTACRQVLSGGAQGNVVDARKKDGVRSGLTMNALVEPSGGGANVQLQLEQTPPGGKSLQVQKEFALAYGRKKAVSGPGYRLGLLAEGAAGAKPADQDDE